MPRHWVGLIGPQQPRQRAICALYPDQFANVAAIYRMKYMLFKRLQHNPVLERLCAEAILAPDRDT
jgi:hypothetical protein